LGNGQHYLGEDILLETVDKFEENSGHGNRQAYKAATRVPSSHGTHSVAQSPYLQADRLSVGQLIHRLWYGTWIFITVFTTVDTGSYPETVASSSSP
jgi:hypothetical protein